MPQSKRTFAPGYANYTGPRLFGAPVGDLSAFQTVLATIAIGALSFFAATFFGILGISVLSIGAPPHDGLQRRAYKFVGVPVGLLMLFATGLYLGSILDSALDARGPLTAAGSAQAFALRCFLKRKSWRARRPSGVIGVFRPACHQNKNNLEDRQARTVALFRCARFRHTLTCPWPRSRVC